MEEILSPAPKGSIIDTHAHYDDKRFDGLLDELMEKMEQLGVDAIINNTVDLDSSAAKCLEISKKYPICYTAVGIHPELTEKGSVVYEEKLLELCKREKVVAIGEIGLDYYWSKENKENQKTQFARQIEIANKLSLPVIVHDREAHEDTLNILKELRPKGAVHCFSGSVEMAKEIVKTGMFIGVGGVVTFNNARKLVEVVREIPLERILLETDAPYLAPVPYRSKLCNSAYLVRVAEKIAEIKGVSRETVFAVTKQNAKDLYKI